MGPVQVLVVGYDNPSFSGEVMAEFARLREAGIVRLVDVLLVEHTADGVFETLAVDENIAGSATKLADDLGRAAGALLGGGVEGEDGEPGDTWSLRDAVPPGSAAAIALIEHVWAEPLTAAIGRSGGRLLEETWLTTEDQAALAALVPTGTAEEKA